MPPRVAVVGHCAAGKSTIVAALQQHGVDAQAVAQEHSAVHDLWNHSQPDIIVFLDVALADIRRRRDNPNWPEWLYDLQSGRLIDARAHADLVLDTSELSVNEIVARVLALIERAGQS